MELKSNEVIVNASPETIREFLMNMENTIHLLPKDKISDFKADTNQCSFKVQGGVTISLIQDGHKSNDEIYMKSGAGSPFPFKLTVHLNAIDNSTSGYIHFDGEVNMFLKMMVEKPLSALFNYMSEQLKAYYQ